MLWSVWISYIGFAETLEAKINAYFLYSDICYLQGYIS